MKQQIMAAPGEIEISEVAIPCITPGEVLVAIRRIGICGSDIHVYHGKHPYVTYPLTQGHEVSGEIVKVGNEVEGLSIGQKVTIEPQDYCGRCHPCRHGKYNLCEELKVMGFQTKGAASEYFAIDANKVTPLPSCITYDEGAMIEPLAVTVHAANQAGNLIDKNIIIIGAGPIGILLCQTVKAFGAKHVVMTDISDYRLSLAKSCGADRICNTAKVDFNQMVYSSFGDDKADVIFDCAGNDTTINQAIYNARKGSVIILVAVFADIAKVDLAKLNDSELDLRTSMMYTHEDYLGAIEIIEKGKVNLSRLITKHFKLRDYKKAYEFIDEHGDEIMKVMIDIKDDF